jgi:fibronectin-binding autotransporter adhesin
MGGWGSSGGDGQVVLSGSGQIYIGSTLEMAYAAGSHTTVHLNGGTLTAKNITKGNGVLADLHFNGGTFIPNTNGQTMAGLTAAYVSTNGAIIDTSLASYTIAQALTTDPALNGAIDGGLTKLGANTLIITSTGNTFNGPISVTEGTLRTVSGATNDLFIAAGAVCDATAGRLETSDLSGEGLLTNGTYAVHGVLDCGTNNAPAGAAMTVENLSMVKGSTFVCEWTTNAVGEVTNDFVTVTGTLVSEGSGFIDLNRTEADPITIPFEVTIMSYGSLSGSFTGWKAINTGLPAGQAIATAVTTSNNEVTVKIRYGGTVILIR